ncbi:lasso peptide biosynthesis B2 protein [Paucibacter sp. PLA-PC-4]|uniref:lasso peptide biosynthesis B2 protein n=1 Tax=Paucibacter sp. PLA-PC-4 TaxID=2993655 RepID=UPI00224A5316|nr:lasso peptide biosynthesis B2 protein [Paucibacter sp. PLA-PC-4]MCX2864902.1 lasso peptide biosynthesis B2 protein [Paucibacter sp. PLA-PC-4]
MLDLKHGRYLGVSNAVSTSLFGHIEGWPAPSEPAEAAAAQDTQRAALQSLVAQGLLTEAQVAPMSTNALEMAGASIHEGPPAASGFPSMRRSLQFASSVALAGWCLRFCSLQTIARSITAHRERLCTPGSESLEAMRPALLAYETLRPFVFTAREKCLLDSLALVMFLAKDGLLPRWVIGVRTGPFGAHSWVQCGTTVLNDQHEYVRQFRPILVV